MHIRPVKGFRMYKKIDIGRLQRGEQLSAAVFQVLFEERKYVYKEILFTVSCTNAVPAYNSNSSPNAGVKQFSMYMVKRVLSRIRFMSFSGG